DRGFQSRGEASLRDIDRSNSICQPGATRKRPISPRARRSSSWPCNSLGQGIFARSATETLTANKACPTGVECGRSGADAEPSPSRRGLKPSWPKGVLPPDIEQRPHQNLMISHGIRCLAPLGSADPDSADHAANIVDRVHQTAPRSEL